MFAVPLFGSFLELHVDLVGVHGDAVVAARSVDGVHPLRVVGVRNLAVVAEELGERDDLTLLEAHAIHEPRELRLGDRAAQNQGQDSGKCFSRMISEMILYKDSGKMLL